jgi:hypothetical protein
MSGAGNPPWDVDSSGYPSEEVRSARLEYLVRYAVLAPSTHNSQPWIFRVRDDALELLADESRALPICDPFQREMLISCGAALQFARLAARNLGRAEHIHLLPDTDDPDLLARLKLGGRTSPTRSEVLRFEAIRHRHTNRTVFRDDLAAADLASLTPLAEHLGARFVSSCDKVARDLLGELVNEADQFQMANPALRQELARWIRPTGSQRRDGMSVGSFGLPDRLSAPIAWAIGMFDLGTATAQTHRELVETSPCFGLLWTFDDDRRSWLHCGMALADVLLELTARGLAVSFLNQPIELATYRQQVARLFGADGHPQMLMRIGRAGEIRPAARRTSDQVTLLQ